MTLRRLSWILMLVAALVLVIGWGRDVPTLPGWLPDVGTTRVMSGGTAATPRKCRGATQVLYTDGPCPGGTREEGVDGGSVTVLPAQRPPATATAPASAQTPLRRLAGPDDSAAQRERVLDQALQR